MIRRSRVFAATVALVLTSACRGPGEDPVRARARYDAVILDQTKEETVLEAYGIPARVEFRSFRSERLHYQEQWRGVGDVDLWFEVEGGRVRSKGITGGPNPEGNAQVEVPS